MSNTQALLLPREPHQFRRSLRVIRLKRAMRNRRGITAQDVREFLMAYCACFLAVGAFIF